jgi:thiamine-phosphate pyrophosphorylase
MPSRHTRPRQWLIADERNRSDLPHLLRKLPRGSGVLVLFGGLPARHRQQLLRQVRRAAASKRLLLVDEAAGAAARVHNLRELRRALQARTPLILLSPMFETRSHQDWQPLPKMRAAALARLGGRRLIALGGMDQRRFAAIARLGFVGWAGISAWDGRAKSRGREPLGSG